MLTSPEYHSFEELEKKMMECPVINVPSGAVKILVMEEGIYKICYHRQHTFFFFKYEF